jgi:hypothetical protein
MNGWSKEEEGWYTHISGATVQRWYRAAGSPGGKPGWYAWGAYAPEDEWTLCRTMKEARSAALGEEKP